MGPCGARERPREDYIPAEALHAIPNRPESAATTTSPAAAAEDLVQLRPRLPLLRRLWDPCRLHGDEPRPAEPCRAGPSRIRITIVSRPLLPAATTPSVSLQSVHVGASLDEEALSVRLFSSGFSECLSGSVMWTSAEKVFAPDRLLR